VFAAARKQGVPVVLLRPGAAGLKKLSETLVPESVKAELSATLATGDDVVVPVRPVPLDGGQQVAWWRFEPASGQLIGVMPGGRGQALGEYTEAAVISVSEIECLRDFSRTNEFADFVGCSLTGAVLGGLGLGGLFEEMEELEAALVFATVLGWHEKSYH
jgi:hypothetical protein